MVLVLIQFFFEFISHYNVLEYCHSTHYKLKNIQLTRNEFFMQFFRFSFIDNIGLSFAWKQICEDFKQRSLPTKVDTSHPDSVNWRTRNELPENWN